MLKLFRRKAEDSILPTGDEPPLVPPKESWVPLRLSNRSSHQVLRKNSHVAQATSNRNSYPLPDNNNYRPVPAPNREAQLDPLSGRNHDADSASNALPSRRNNSSVPIPNKRVLRRSYCPDSATNHNSHPLPPISESLNAPPSRSNHSSVLRKSYHPGPASNSNFHPPPLSDSSGRSGRSVPASYREAPHDPFIDRNVVPALNAPPGRNHSSAPASNNRILRKSYYAGPASNSNAHPLPPLPESSERNDRSVPAPNRNPRPPRTSERNYRAVPATDRKVRVRPTERNYHSGPVSNSEALPKKNDQQVPASNQNSHPSREGNHRSVPAPNRNPRPPRTSERNYRAVPVSNTNNAYQAPRRNYHAVPVPNSNPQLAPGLRTQSCNYCHRRPKFRHYDQCGRTCGNAAKVACLLCRSRPTRKYGRVPLCTSCCKLLPTMRAPLLLEAPLGHSLWKLVLTKFENNWHYGACPTIMKIYKVIGSKRLLERYEQYRQRMGKTTEVFCYHGTSRKCTIGSNGNTLLCNDSACALCSILKSSFKTSCADSTGAFGPGIYTSSAANKAYSYSANGQGALLVTKVVLGRAYRVNSFAAVRSCPPGYNSVVFDRHGGALNETVVYTDDAIRPVFLILFQ